MEYTNARLNPDTEYVTFVRYGIAADNDGDEPLLGYSETMRTRTGEFDVYMLTDYLLFRPGLLLYYNMITVTSPLQFTLIKD